MAKQIILKWRDVIETKVKFFLEKLNCFKRYSGCLPFTNILREIRLEYKKEHDFLGLPNGKFREQRNIWKGSPFLEDGTFQTEIRVPIVQGHLWYQFQAFEAVFQKMELICTNGKGDSGTKFTGPELCDHLPEPWTDRFAHVNGKKP